MAKKINQKYYCHQCSEELNEDNCRPANSVSGYSHLCISCEQSQFNSLAQTEGKHIALFHTCASLNVACLPIVLEDCQDEFSQSNEAWILYINKLAEKKQDTKRGKILGFADGLTSLAQCFGKDLDHKDFVAYITKEREKILKQAKLAGTEIQQEKWGKVPIYKGLPMTQELYDELDMLYENRAEGLKGTTITPQIDYTLMTVAKNMAIYNHLLRNGLIKPAQDLYKNIDAMLASEELRKKDEKPIANFAPDAWVDAFERAGLMQDGQFLTLPEIEDAMIKIMRGKGYNQTLDAAHQLELNILNNARKNADQQTIFELPEDMRINDELGEFAETESDEEREAREYAQLTPVRFEKSEN
jgi:hypothetical protein